MSDWPSSGADAPRADVPRHDPGVPPNPSGSDPASPGDSGSTHADPRGTPPGLGEQFGRTRNAVLGLVAAHVDLAKAEFSEIIAEIKRAVMLGSVALGLLFVAATILTVGSVLWLDEWWFGSMGWGVLHGTEIFLAIAAVCVLAIVGSSGRIVGAGFLALVIAVIVTLIFGFRLTSQALGWVGDQAFTGLAVSAADRPIAVGMIVIGVVFAAVGLLIGLVVGHGFMGRIGAAIGIAIVAGLVGIGFGALLGVPMSWVCAIAVGLAAWLLFWPVFAALMVLRSLDTEKLKHRFMPDQTIETTKETIEWVRAQTPLGRKS